MSRVIFETILFMYWLCCCFMYLVSLHCSPRQTQMTSYVMHRGRCTTALGSIARECIRLHSRLTHYTCKRQGELVISLQGGVKRCTASFVDFAKRQRGADVVEKAKTSITILQVKNISLRFAHIHAERSCHFDSDLCSLFFSKKHVDKGSWMRMKAVDAEWEEKPEAASWCGCWCSNVLMRSKLSPFPGRDHMSGHLPCRGDRGS